MKYFNLSIFLLTLLSQGVLAQGANRSEDRTQINKTMTCFFKWDLEGGAETAKKCISENVLYHRLNEKIEYVTNTPDLDSKGKGKGAHEHNIVDIDIYDNMAVVTALLRYNPQSPRNTYMKTFILYKVAAGWRVTNVTWGKVTNTQ